MNSYVFNGHGAMESRFPEILAPLSLPVELSRWWPNEQCKFNHFGVGQPGSGLPFHWHTLVHGHEVLYGTHCRQHMIRVFPDCKLSCDVDMCRPQAVVSL